MRTILRTILLATAVGVSALFAAASSGAGLEWLRVDPIATADSLFQREAQQLMDRIR